MSRLHMVAGCALALASGLGFKVFAEPVPAPKAGDSSPPACGGGVAADGSRDAEAMWTVKRVAGNMDAQVRFENGTYTLGTGRIPTPLPEGYPGPTAFGAIELKRYPSVRRAEVSGRVNSDMGMNAGFWPLFQHIKRRNIAMTSPVEMDYHSMPVDAPKAEAPKPTDEPERRVGGQDADWTMSFLYRTADLGPTGEDRNVRILDTEPMTVLAIGFQGPYFRERVERELTKLEEWLKGQSEWVAAGTPRAFYYNGPEVSNRNKWGEVQVPVRRVALQPAAAAEHQPEAAKPAAPQPSEGSAKP
ncbi:MAG: heme-binding protein [Phycisphaerales bacterium]|nr:heme-binding protein [Phycisphaerales bacterium]